MPSSSAPTLPQGLRDRLTAQSLKSQLPEQAFGRAVLFNLGALSLLALLVAWFLQYQTAVLWLRRQWPAFRLLLLQGVPTERLGLIFGGCLLGLGLLAGVLGVVAGQALAQLLAAQGLGPMGQEPSLRPGPWLLTKALLSSLLVPALAAAISWRQRVGELSIVDAEPTTRGWLLACVVIGVGALTVLLVRHEATGLFGAFGAILLLCLLGAALVGPLLIGLRQFFFRGIGARWLAPSLSVLLGLRELLRYPRDVSAALAALMLAVATSIGIGTMVESFREDFRSMLLQRLDAPVRIEGGAQQLAAAAAWLEARQDPALSPRSVSPRYRTRVTLEGLPVEVLYRPFDERLRRSYALAEVPAEDAVLLNERAARSLGSRAGDRFELLGKVVKRQPFILATATQACAWLLRCLSSAGSTGESRVRAFLGLQPGVEAVLDQLLLYGSQADGANSMVEPALLSRLEQRFADLTITEREAVRTRALQIFDQTFAITGSLTTLALLVASVGLYGALVALGLLQAPTQALLLMLGQGTGARWQWLLGRSLAVLLATLLLAVPLGLLLAALLCGVVNPRGFGWTVPLQLSGTALLWPMLVTLLAALAAGVMSAPRERLQ